MNSRLRVTLLLLALGSGAACGTMRTEPATAPAAGLFDRASASGPAALTGDKSVPLTARRMPKWNPLWWFGNVDDPEPPDWYRPGSPGRRLLWQLRNPLHNFTFYVIGVADQPFTRSGRFPQAVFAPDGGWNWAVTKHSCVRLPFVSYNGERGRFYLGWRERGNLGGKVNFGRLKTTDRRPQTSAGTMQLQRERTWPACRRRRPGDDFVPPSGVAPFGRRTDGVTSGLGGPPNPAGQRPALHTQLHRSGSDLTTQAQGAQTNPLAADK